MNDLSEAEKKSSPKGENKPSVGSVVQAISVLRHVGELEDGAGVTAIAQSLSISPSSCFNILKTLVAEDFLEFDRRHKTYRLGLGAIDLARRALGNNNVLPAIRRRLHALSREFDIAVGLWRTASGRRFVLVYTVESEQATRIHMSVGQRVPFFAGAIGRSYAAIEPNLSKADVKKGIEAVRWQARPQFQEYLQQVKTAQEVGWAIDPGQWRSGVTTVASSIVDNEGIFRFGITASMFTGQHDEATLKQICDQIRELAEYASHRAFGEVEMI